MDKTIIRDTKTYIYQIRLEVQGWKHQDYEEELPEEEKEEKKETENKKSKQINNFTDAALARLFATC